MTSALGFFTSGPSPTVSAEHTEKLALRTHGQSRMQKHAQGSARFGADMSQALSGRMGDVIESGGVLRTKDNRRVPESALESTLGVRLKNPLEGNFIVGTEAIGCFGIGPVAARLGDGSQRLLHELPGDEREVNRRSLKSAVANSVRAQSGSGSTAGLMFWKSQRVR